MEIATEVRTGLDYFIKFIRGDHLADDSEREKMKEQEYRDKTTITGASLPLDEVHVVDGQMRLCAIVKDPDTVTIEYFEEQ